MLVQAKATGFYGNKRLKEGTKFMLKNEKDFSANWMEKLDDKILKSKAKAKEDSEIVTFDEESETKKNVI